jgi:hypothetical protein
MRPLSQVLPDSFRVALLRRVAAHAVSIIRERTARGVDVNGSAFAPYSEEYARLKAGSGRSASSPNLTLGGGMLANLVVLSVTPEQALLGFQGSTTAYQFRRIRTKNKGTPTSRKLGNGQRATHTLGRSTSGTPVSNALKAAAHDRGTEHVPRRHFFGLSTEERRKLIEEAARTLRLRTR